LATALAATPARRDLWRIAIIASGAAAILAPVALVVYQSFLSAPFFSARPRFSLDAYAFVLGDEDFWAAGLNSIVLAASMVAIAVPVGAVLAYLVVRTDLPGRRALETLVRAAVRLADGARLRLRGQPRAGRVPDDGV
jgi:iron(III) transport system permease protein